MKATFLTATTSLLLGLALCFAGTLGATYLSNNRLTVAATKSGDPPPDLALVNALDKVIQQRFLTAPNFGIRRIGPTPNPHLEHFEPRNPKELQAVTNLQNADWKVGIYLIGRRAYEIPSPKEGNASKRLTVYYHLNQPVPVTTNVKKRELPNPKRIKEHADEAFQRFASTDTYDFSLGKWSYVARPLRAKETCLKCHTDFFLTSKENKVYAYRKRRVGDPIGVVLYAVRKEQ